mmetsp:Transcript_89418/g.109432  ORF Transcript_89418/g.109432 Transcript_89418/m.109432 type:complete len:255 (+) Transcript_89418:283-1047(+)
MSSKTSKTSKAISCISNLVAAHQANNTIAILPNLVKTLCELHQVLKENGCALDDTSELHTELVPEVQNRTTHLLSYLSHFRHLRDIIVQLDSLQFVDSPEDGSLHSLHSTDGLTTLLFLNGFEFPDHVHRPLTTKKKRNRRIFVHQTLQLSPADLLGHDCVRNFVQCQGLVLNWRCHLVKDICLGAGEHPVCEHLICSLFGQRTIYILWEEVHSSKVLVCYSLHPSLLLHPFAADKTRQQVQSDGEILWIHVLF